MTDQDDKPGGSTPSQYGLPEGATELQDLIEHRGMNFALGNIFKACYRRGTCSHSDELRDMRKVLWFAQREVDRLEAEQAKLQQGMDDAMEAVQQLTAAPMTPDDGVTCMGCEYASLSTWAFPCNLCYRSGNSAVDHYTPAQ